MNCSNYNKILHLLAGIALGYLMFACETKTYTYRIDGWLQRPNFKERAHWFADSITVTRDSVWYRNSDSSIVVIHQPFKVIKLETSSQQ